MRMRTVLVLVAVLFAAEPTLHAGRPRARARTGQARSAEVLARRTAASPRGAREWGGTMMAYTRAGQKDVRRELRTVEPHSASHAGIRGKQDALVQIREVVGKNLGLTPGQLASKDRRHHRAVAKQLRRMLRQVRTARASGRPFRDAFPHSYSASYGDLESTLATELSDLKAAQAASRRTTH